MADLRFNVISKNGQQYLGIEQEGQIVHVYRCVLHQDKYTATTIPSGYTLKDTSGRWFSLIRDFAPVLYTNQSVSFQGVPVKITTTGEDRDFSIGTRLDIQGAGETSLHLRFRRWQIYLFAPTTSDKIAIHPGLWEPIKINQPYPDGAFPDVRPPGYGP